MALKAGVELFHGVRVERIVVSGGRATGVVARTRGKDGLRRTITVHARAVVIAAGTLQTPGLLERNGLAGASGELGRNLSIHPAAACLAEFDEKIDGLNAIPQGYSIEEFLADKESVFEAHLWRTVYLAEELGSLLEALEQQGRWRGNGDEAAARRRQLQEHVRTVRALIERDRPLAHGDQTAGPQWASP